MHGHGRSTDTSCTNGSSSTPSLPRPPQTNPSVHLLDPTWIYPASTTPNPDGERRKKKTTPRRWNSLRRHRRDAARPPAGIFPGGCRGRKTRATGTSSGGGSSPQTREGGRTGESQKEGNGGQKGGTSTSSTTTERTRRSPRPATAPTRGTTAEKEGSRGRRQLRRHLR